MTIITSILALPSCPFNDTDYVGVAVTSGVTCYYRVEGVDLNNIVSVRWYPKNPSSLEFSMRELILVDNTVGTFMIKVENNFLDTTDRAGHISFALDTGETLTFPVKTYGPVSVGPLWTAPGQGLITG